LFHLYSCANGRFHLVDCNMIFVFDYDYLWVNMNIGCITYQVRKQYPQIGFMNFLWKLICLQTLEKYVRNWIAIAAPFQGK
jgi:hypothetical protein